MKTNLESIIIGILLSCMFVSCNTRPQNQVIIKTADTVIKDIPRDAIGKPLWFYQKKAELERMAGLSSLENGFDSLQIRVWYGVSLKDELQLLLVKRTAVGWSAELDSLVLHYDEQRDSVTSITKIIENKRPVSGWEKFVDSLDKFGIFTLPDAHGINDYAEGQDGYGVTIEFASNNRYRIYNYPSFNEQKKVAEATKIEEIMKLIEKEFGFRRLSMR